MAAELPSRDDVITRLHKSVCMYKGKPVYITCDPDVQLVNGGRELNIHLVRWYNLKDTTDTGVCDYREKEFSNSSPLLGYMYYNGIAIYVTRVADRKFSLGLTSSNCSFGENNEYGHRDMFLKKEMEDCILGNHPSFATARRKLEGSANIKSVPIHRHFAIERTSATSISLLYRCEVIAVKQKNNSEFIFLHTPTIADKYRNLLLRENIKLS